LLFTFDARGRLPILGGASDTALPPGDLDRWARLAAQTGDSATLLLDCGNTFFPGALSRFSYGNAMNEILSQARVSAKRVTERDFLMGRGVLDDLRRKSPAAFLASNLADDSSRGPYPAVYRARAGGREVAVYALIDPEAADAPGGLPAGWSAREPERALRDLIAAERPESGRFRVCLADDGLLRRHPGILSVPGIDVFAAGSPAGSHVVQEALNSGAWVLHVPPFSQGYGSLSVGPDGDFDYDIDTAHAAAGDSLELRRMTRQVARWSSFYLRENDRIIRTLAKPLASGQAVAVASLVRERLHAEAACVERSLVQDIALPREVRARDLDRLLVSSPDLYVLRIEGSELRSLGRDARLACSGLAGKRAIDADEIYAVALTETGVADAFPEALESSPEYHPVLSPEPLFEAVREDLARRRGDDWDFAGLGGRWRLAGLITVDASRRDVHVWNGDSVYSVPGNIQPLSTWELELRAPLRLYTDLQSIDFSPEASYSRANGQVGSNLLAFRLDYSYGPRPAIRPYASGTYETYVTGGGGSETWPVRVRGSTGLQSSLGAWTLKLGAASEKTIAASDPDPFAPFAAVFADDTTRWDRGAEFVIQGRQDIGKFLQRRWPKAMRAADLTADVAWNNFIGASEEGGRAESRLRVDLSAEIIGGLQVSLGAHSIFAYLFGGGGSLASVEPSLALSAAYRFKTLP
jgi:hypothetical protein